MFATSSTMSTRLFLSTQICLVSRSRCIRRRASRACRAVICNSCSTDPVRAVPDSQLPTPGGWNRIQIEVEDLEATVEKLKSAGGRFRNAIVTGNGGKQIL